MFEFVELTEGKWALAIDGDFAQGYISMVRGEFAVPLPMSRVNAERLRTQLNGDVRRCAQKI